MKNTRTKLFAFVFFTGTFLLITTFRVAPVTVAAYSFDDPATTYKAKCAACHTATASKFFDPAKTDEEHVQVIMKGKKGAKPPFMPAYSEKGMTEDEAKTLAAYMRTLKPKAN